MEEQRRFFHIMKTLWVSVGDGATQATGPADVKGETGRTPALGPRYSSSIKLQG